MKIFKAEFAKGVIGQDYSTQDNLPQFAFLGRSNSGKSSVINSLTGMKNLVRASKMPGKTIEANFYSINGSFYLADFPGYGFARRSIADRNRMVKRMFWYLEFSSERPKAVFLVIDANVGLTDLDLEMLEFINSNNHHLIILANKIDKLPQAKRAEKISAIMKEAQGAEVLEYSAKTEEGKERLLKKIESFL